MAARTGEKQVVAKKAVHRARCIEYDMTSFIDLCVIAYLDLAGIAATKMSAKAATPFVDETNAFTRDEPEGKLANTALKAPMKILYAGDTADQICCAPRAHWPEGSLDGRQNAT